MTAASPLPRHLPDVTVLLPVRDAAATIDAALGSIRDQTHRDLEILVVDDGSVDDTPARLAQHGAADDRVQILRLDRPAGIVAALNAGLARARAPWLARMDADDIAHPQRLARQRAFLDTHPDVDICDTHVEIARGDGPAAGGFQAYNYWLDSIETHDDFVREFLVENPVAHPAAMARTALLREIGGYRDGPFPEDYDLWLRCLRAGACFHKLPERLLRWTDGDHRLTRTDPRYAQRAFFELKWEHLLRTRLSGAERVAIWGAGTGARPWRRALAQSDPELVAVFDIDPAKIGRTRQGVLVRPVEDVEAVDFDLLIIAVGARGARAEIREQLARTALREVEDFVFVA